MTQFIQNPDVNCSFSFFRFHVNELNFDAEELNPNPNPTVLMWMISFCFYKIKGKIVSKSYSFRSFFPLSRPCTILSPFQNSKGFVLNLVLLLVTCFLLNSSWIMLILFPDTCSASKLWLWKGLILWVWF